MQNSSGTVEIPAEFIKAHMRKLNLSSIRTFLFLCTAAADGSDASVSIPAIAEGTGFTERVTIDALNDLEEKGSYAGSAKQAPTRTDTGSSRKTARAPGRERIFREMR